jgi:hypothetical protein
MKLNEIVESLHKMISHKTFQTTTELTKLCEWLLSMPMNVQITVG